MAIKVYTKALENLMAGNIDLDANTVKAMLVDADYTPNYATDDALADIPAGGRIATSAALTSKTVTDGVFDAADTVFNAVAAGSTVTGTVVFIDSGVEATSWLLCHIDGAAQGYPLTTNGQNINQVWNASGIMRLLAS